MVATDFFCKNVWTPMGKRLAYVLMFIHLGSRKVFVSPSTCEQIVKTPFQAPIANAFAESWIGSLKRECLNAMWCFSLRQVDYVVQSYVTYYNTAQPHQSLGNVPLAQSGAPPAEQAADTVGPVYRHAMLGGLLNHYERKAA